MTQPQKTLIEGKVAKILNNRELVINKGTKDGVTFGMKFNIFGQDEIRDPDTNEKLGSIERERTRVKVIDVQPRFSIAQTFETYQTLFSGGFRLSDFMNPTATKVKTIRTDSSEKDFSTTNALVSISDRAVEVPDVEQEASRAK